MRGIVRQWVKVREKFTTISACAEARAVAGRSNYYICEIIENVVDNAK